MKINETTDIAALRLMSIDRIVEISKGAAPMMGEKELLAETALYWERENQSSLRAFKDAATELFAVQEQLEAERQRADAADSRLHEVSVHCANVEAEIAALKTDIESYISINGELATEVEALKAKLANPVVHPTRAAGHSYASVAISARDEQWFTAINEAGFPVEAE